MLNLNRKLLHTLFYLDDPDILEGESAYEVFVASILTEYIEEIHTYDEDKLWNGDDEEREREISKVEDIFVRKERQFSIEVSDKSEKVETVMIFNKENEDEIIEFIFLADLNWQRNKNYSKLAQDAQEQFDEDQKESKDPYTRYGVSRGDF